MKNNKPEGLEGLTSSLTVLVAELLFGIFCLGFVLFLFYGIRQGLPRGLFGMVFALTVIGAGFLTRAVEGFKLKHRIKRLQSIPTNESAEQCNGGYGLQPPPHC